MTAQQRATLAEEFNKISRIAVAEPVAVVGIGCRFPGDVVGPDSFWDLLVEGRNAISRIPADRWDADAFYDPDPLTPGRMTTKWGGFVPDIAGFDAEFFGITPREAAAMDPQQRMLLEVSHEALENAGIPPDSLAGSRTGVMMGVYFNEYQSMLASSPENVDAYSGTGNAHSITVGRISYLLGLRGPSVAVDTACSSSLVAVHLACQSLRLRETDLALAGGVSVTLRPETQIAISAWGLLSPQGRCATFDAAADGFVRSEGAGVVVLKRLTDAIRDGDQVLAVVRGSAVNQDGRSNGVTAPNTAAQCDVIADALRSGDVAPESVNYVEAHGTGTVLGDPIEFEALAATYGRGEGRCALGAVKTNLGHLEAAAGIAGFIKATLSVQHAQVPPNLHFSQWNPAINAASTRFFVPTEHGQWPTGEGQVGPRRAAVSSFGLGGTNAHVIIEQGPELAPVAGSDTDTGVSTLVVTGKTPQRVAATATVLADWMEGPGAEVALADVAHTVNHHRAQQAKFGTVLARERAEAVAGLRALAAGQQAPGVVGPVAGSHGPGTVFVYSGRGSQWVGMGRQLLSEEADFAAAVAGLEPVFVAEAGFSLHDVLANGRELVGIEQIQLGLIGMQLALTTLWRSYGVEPDAVIGHSLGEVAAAVVAGALTPAEGLRVTATRSRLMAPLSGQGGMAMLGLDAETTQSLIADYPQVTLGIYNSPRQTVISGPTEQIDELIGRVRGQNRFASRVNIEVAPHNPAMDALQPAMRAELADLSPRTPTIPVFSTTYDDVDTLPTFDAEHWATNMRNPVRFQQALTAAAGSHYHTFVEISAHPLLTQAITDTLADAQPGTIYTAVGSLQRDTDDTMTFHTNLNTAHTRVPPQTPHRPEPHPKLPTTPWHHTRHWLDSAGPSAAVAPGTRGHNGVALSPNGIESTALDGWSYQLEWPVCPRGSAETVSTGSWLVLSDPELSDEIARVARVEFLAPSALDDASALGDVLAGVDNVLYAPPVTGDPVDVESAYRLFHAARRLAAVMAASSAQPKLFVLTRNAQPVSEGERANPAHAVLWGLGRTLALEHPEIWGGVIDLDESLPAELAARYVLNEAACLDGEDQVVYRSGVRRAPRLRRRNATAASPVELSDDTSHLVVGATGNIGPHLIRQLAGMGARTIVAVSRTPGARLAELTGLAESLESSGTSLVQVAADATDPAAMTALFDRFGADLPPLAGIYLAAFAGQPVLLGDMTDEDVAAMFRPKLDVARLLHRLSLKHPVQQFVSFSSISGLIGSRWLAHYTATSAFLDTLGYARRLMGLPATVVAWGLWKSLADAQQDASQVSTESGLQPMADEVAIGALASAMSPDAAVHSVVVAADWPLLATAYRTRGALRIVDDLLPTPGETALPESEFRTALRKCQPERRHDMLFDQVGALAASVMGMPPTETLDPSAGFFQLGMDSLMSVTLQRALSESLGEFLPASVVFDYPTVYSLTDYLAGMLPEFVEAEGEPAADAYDEFTEAELLEQLSERLRGTQ